MGHQVGVGQKAGNHNFDPLSPKFPTQPPIKSSAAVLWDSQAAPLLPPRCSCLQRPDLVPARSASLFQSCPPARSPSPSRPASSQLVGKEWGLSTPRPSPQSPARPHPSCQPPLAKAKPSSPLRRPGGCCPNAGRRRGDGGGGQAGVCGLHVAAAFAPSPHSERDAASMGTAWPRFLPPNRERLGCGHLPALDAGAEQPSALFISRSRKRRASPCAGCRSHHMLLTPTVSVPAVLGHGGPGTGGGEALSVLSLLSRLQVAGGGRLYALAGRSSLRL